jgi:peptide/nickel transport system permease protein
MTARGETIKAGIELPHARRGAGTVSWVAGFARSKPVGACSAAILAFLILLAVFAPTIATFKPDENHRAARLVSPNGTYFLGTDQFGRDVFSRIVYGARISVQVGLISTVVALVLSASIGITAGYFGGAWDYLTGRVIDVAQALPGLVLLITLLAAVGRSLYSVSFVLGFTTGIIGSRVVRGATLAVTAQPFIEVAKSIGCSPLRVLMRHMLINVAPILIVLATINIGSAIIAEASLSVLGYGVPPPAPSWGGMMSREGRQYMVDAPWLFLAPTVALALVVFSVNMLGDALRDKLDPRLRGG